jgi:hypothetical protein
VLTLFSQSSLCDSDCTALSTVGRLVAVRGTTARVGCLRGTVDLGRSSCFNID